MCAASDMVHGGGATNQRNGQREAHRAAGHAGASEPGHSAVSCLLRVMWLLVRDATNQHNGVACMYQSIGMNTPAAMHPVRNLLHMHLEIVLLRLCAVWNFIAQRIGNLGFKHGACAAG